MGMWGGMLGDFSPVAWNLTKAGKVAAGACDKEQYPWARAPHAVSRIPLLFCLFNEKEQKWLRKRILFLNF